MKCPTCDQKMQPAFCNKASGISYTNPDLFENFVIIDKDLSEAGIKKFLPHRAEWHPSSICKECKIYTIEYGISMSRTEVEELLELK